MRSRVLAGLALAGVAAALTFTATPASAVCQVYIDGHCYNACTVAGIVYNPVRHATGDRLPELLCAA